MHEVYEILDSHLAPIEIPDGFTAPIADREWRATSTELFRVYTDSYIDLLRLLEEIQFEAALAVLILLDYRYKRERGEAPSPHERTRPLPVEAIALIRRYFREIPPPAELFHAPHTRISGNRMLGRWFAGQLLDSVLYRTVAACDRLAILLWAHAEVPLRTRKDGRPIHPAFRLHYLEQLAARYRSAPAWSELLSFVDNPLFEAAKNLRDGFTHSQRIASELHGDDLVVYGADYVRGAAPVEAIGGDDHVALAVGSYDAVLRPLVRLTGDLLAPRAASA